jgi:hypothetical protein
MQYLEVSRECTDFNSFKNKIKSFLGQYKYEFDIIIPPHINESDALPLYYNIPCYLKKRKNSFGVFVDLYVEDVSPVNALLIITDDLLTAELISQKLSLYLMN